MSDQQPTVSICCITYNHERFITHAIEGFLMQKTNFRFEVIIGNDSSADRTAEVAAEFVAKYPDKIKLVSTEANMGIHKNLINTLKECTGKYVAFCEGDDFWTDPYKLQKQVDFLENNQDYIICCHYTRVVDPDNNTIYVHPNPRPFVYTYLDLLAGKQEETKTATVVYRNIPEVHDIIKEPWFFKSYAGDKMFKLWATMNTGKKIYVIPEVMSCYCNHAGGIWSMIDTNVRKGMMISDFNLIIKNFNYPARHKKRLLYLYMKRYFLFEMRNSKINKAFSTIKYLL
ncbi:glycosyltransferase family 2 protein [Mucilaginibacter sabulilitoris]|uniref:Glycosyltransferase family 2 protein n=1 Tax=Mucilaginibacter sabulilitoris TaxID=1173583 RepID=A0ABZ0TQ75_9SPHI|nr:glycosyltransferase family 2 protein [Mucilaginibacter sabulilitoris]WPU95295.1 glycosyltransferase family 2 protein [Mucilaginibacter sabulilitoris]